MATERRSKSASEILSTLHALSLDTEEEILAMSLEEVRAHLTTEGINPNAKNAELASRLNAVRGQQRLADARERREAQDSAISKIQPNTSFSIEQTRAEVQRRLGLISPITKPSTQAYFNRFKDMDDDDLPGLLDDLRRLDEQNEEGE